MASRAPDDEAVVFFGDEFVADEILARLPARYTVQCRVLSKRFHQLVASPYFWLRRHRRLGELPHVARLQHHDDRDHNALYFQFHVVAPTFIIEHTVNVEYGTFYNGTCNGLVLASGFSSPDKGELSSSINGIVFNPATKEEARMSLRLPHPGKENVETDILGFGYGPSSKVYKILIREYGEEDITRLMVVSLNGRRGREPRMVFSSNGMMDCQHRLHTADGKVYFLMSVLNLFENWHVALLAFDVDSEAVTKIATPEGQGISPTMMFEVRGCPCIYTQKGHNTMIWLLTVDHRWEQLYNLVKESSSLDDHLLGVWDCGDGILFANFSISGAYLCNLHEAAEEDKVHGPLKNRSKRPRFSWFSSKILWDYQPTLISPSSIFGDAAFSGCGRESVPPEHELDGTFLRMTHKWVVDPMMQLLSKVSPPSG